MLLAIYGWGAYARDKNTCARTLAKKVCVCVGGGRGSLTFLTIGPTENDSHEWIIGGRTVFYNSTLLSVYFTL